ncbi:PorP/SprF family type IX secretion system membrane protein [Bacteroidota bacterium]
MKYLGLKLQIIIFLSIFSFYQSKSQELHFSQVFNVPLLINAAQTGIFNTDYRVSGIYRNQWKRIDVPYKTVCFSFDKNQKILNDFIGIGGYFLHDVSGNNNLEINNIYFSLSYYKYFNNHQVSIGIQPGFVTKQFDTDNIFFGSQYDPLTGEFSHQIPANEEFLLNSIAHFDLNAGVFWRSNYGKYFPSAGFSISHLLKPVESFYEDSDNGRIPMKFNFYSNMGIPIKRFMNLAPVIYYSKSGNIQELVSGTNISLLKYHENNKISSIDLIGYVRSNAFKNLDALIVGAGINIMGLKATITWDLNISSLRKASNFNGAFEFSVAYNGRLINRKTYIEPCFLQ